MINPKRTADDRGSVVLAALNGLGRHIYAGTVPAATVVRRRKANKAARAARRVTRRGTK